MLNSLNIAQSGLYASKFAIENIMNNIANEATPGYKKRIANIAELSHTDSRQAGRGVQVSAASRVTNMFMYDTLISQQSKSSYFKEESTMLGDIESFFYEGDDSGFTSDFDRYLQALENLRVSPYNQTNKNILAELGNTLVLDLQTIYTNLEDKQQSLKKTAYENVEAINGFLYDIGEVNQQMGQSTEVSNDLLDRRDYLESKLAEYIDIEVDRSNDYQLKIGGQVAVRYNTNIHNVKAVEKNTKQIDHYPSTSFASSGTLKYTFNGIASVEAANVNDLVNKINLSEEMKKVIVASVDTEGNLIITSRTDGITGAFDGVLARSKIVPKDLDSIVANNTPLTKQVDNYSNLKDAGILTYSIGGESVTDETLAGLVVKINESVQMNPNIVASMSTEGKLIITSRTDGTAGAFDGVLTRSSNELSTDLKSQVANDDFHIEIFDTELNIKGGMLKAKVDNLDTESANNQIQKYKDMLDNFAKALGDMTSGYISDGNGSYDVSGMSDYIENYAGNDDFQSVGLFRGSSVKTLSFESSVLNDISQNDLDYLAGLQWSEGIKFGDGTQTSFNKYFQILQVAVASDKESIDFKQNTQEAVTESLKSNYDKIIKVDKDEELILLTQFQAAYQASAKLVTIVDELMQTILGMKR